MGASSGRSLKSDGARGATTAGDDGGSDRRPASASWVPQRPQSFPPRSCSPPTDFVPKCDKANSFLVLTLGFLRRLVERSVSSDEGSRGRLDLLAALEKVPVLDAETGLHGRIVDEMSPASYGILVTIVQQTFRLSPDLRGWSDEGGGDTGIRKKRARGNLRLHTFFGATVRGVLATQCGSRDTTGIDEEEGVIFSDQDSVATNPSMSKGGFNVGEEAATSRSSERRWATAEKERDPDANYQAGGVEIARVTGCDITVLADMQRANSHIEFPALAEDARMFAKALARLAEG